jgi:Domain of unknown function (DUF4407)
MIRPGKDDAAREDAFLGGLVPQAAEQLAERRSAEFDAAAGQARFEAWLGAHTMEPALPAPRVRAAALRAAGTAWIRRFVTWLAGALHAIRRPEGGFLIWLSGARQQILAECPTERPKYAGIGASILISGAMAGVSLAFALTTALNTALQVAVLVGAAAAVTIMSLTRLFVVSLPRSGRPGMLFVQAIPRVVVALILGFVISTPLLLQIFRPEIQHEVAVMHNQAAVQYFRDLPSSPLQQQITRDQALVATLTGEAAGNGPQNTQVEALQGELSQAQAQQSADYATWQCQLYGTSPDGRQVCSLAGNGPLARAAETAYQDATSRVSELHAEIAATQAQTAAEARQELPAAEAALKAAQAEQAQQISAFNTQNESNAGLLTRLQALGQVTAGNATLSRSSPKPIGSTRLTRW